MEIYHLIYFSIASRPLKQSELDSIVNVSAANNQNSEITGMLVYRMGFFIQLLEGKKEGVEKLYEKIEKDSRHRDSQILLQYQSDQRIFPQWYMGLISEPLDSKELFDLANSLKKTGINSTEELKKEAISLLKKFSNKYPNR